MKSLLFLGFFVASISGFTQYSPKDIALQKIDSVLNNGTIGREQMMECFLYMADYPDNTKSHRRSPDTFRRNKHPYYDPFPQRHYPAFDGNKLHKISYPESDQEQAPQRAQQSIGEEYFSIIAPALTGLFVGMFIILCILIQRYFSDSKLTLSVMLNLITENQNLKDKACHLEGRIVSMEIEFNLLRESVIAHNKEKTPTDKAHKTDFM